MKLGMLAITPFLLVSSLSACAQISEVQEEVAQTKGVTGQVHTVNCSRTRLDSLITFYFDALAANDPSRITFSPDLRFTENSYLLEPGEGLWETADELKFKRSLLDTERCGTLTQGIIEENGRDIIIAVRLQLKDGLISEVEHIVAREEEFAFNPQGVLDTADEDWESVLDPEMRTSRGAMEAIAYDYFDMFVDIPHVNVAFTSPCNRKENGTLTTPTGDCSPKGLVLTHPDRRFPVSDLEAGITAAFVYFNGALPDVHMFNVTKGEVDLIQAVIGPRTPSTGWPAE